MRWIVALVSAVVLVALLLFGLIALVPTARIAGLAAAEFSRMTGRALTIGGTVRASVWPVLGVRITDVSVANAGWSEEGPMLTADTLALSVDVAALFGGDLRIRALQVDGLTPRDGTVGIRLGAVLLYAHVRRRLRRRQGEERSEQYDKR